MATTTDYESIINEAASKLEARYEQIQHALAPLRHEERDVAEAIHRIVGSYPAGYRPDKPTRRASRPSANGTAPARPSDQERYDAILAFVESQPEGTTAQAIADGIGVSTNTGKKYVDPMLADGRLYSKGEGRGRRIFAPKGK